MTEVEKAEQEVAAARVAERIAEWKAMEAKASYYRYASEAMAASAEVMGARIRRDNATASEWADAVLAKGGADAALTPEDGNDALLADQQDTPPQSNAQASETDAAEEDPTAVAIAAYIEAENADTPTEAERPSVVTDHDRVEQTNTDTLAAVEIPEGFIPWSGGECPVEGWQRVEWFCRDGVGGFGEQARNANTLRWEHVDNESDIVAYRIISEPAKASELRDLGAEADIIAYKVISEPAEASEETSGGEIIEGLQQAVGIASGEDQPARVVIIKPTNPPSELDSQAQAQPQTKSDQSDNPPEEKFSAEKHGGEAGFWTKALEQDRKPQPGIIEETVSRLFGRKMEEA